LEQKVHTSPHAWVADPFSKWGAQTETQKL